jgi:hypothetical protein
MTTNASSLVADRSREKAAAHAQTIPGIGTESAFSSANDDVLLGAVIKGREKRTAGSGARDQS